MKQQFLLELTSSSLAEVQQAAEVLSKLLAAKSVVALSGPMGVGKTEFVKMLCALRGIKNANSPTFALHHHYQASSNSVDHFDLFRTESEDEIESTGFWDLFSQNLGLILIEWSEKMNLQQIPGNWELFFVEMIFLDSQKRNIRISKRV